MTACKQAVSSFLKLEETRAYQTFLAVYGVTQPCGESNFSVEVRNFLNHIDQYRVEFRGDLEFRIVRGLSLSVDGEFSVVRDQRFLPKEGTRERGKEDRHAPQQ